MKITCGRMCALNLLFLWAFCSHATILDIQPSVVYCDVASQYCLGVKSLSKNLSDWSDELSSDNFVYAKASKFDNWQKIAILNPLLEGSMDGHINIRLLSKLAAATKVRGETERRTAVYMPVHEDLSTVSTKQFTDAVGFAKKSIGNMKMHCNNYGVCVLASIIELKSGFLDIVAYVTGDGGLHWNGPEYLHLSQTKAVNIIDLSCNQAGYECQILIQKGWFEQPIIYKTEDLGKTWSIYALPKS